MTGYSLTGNTATLYKAYQMGLGLRTSCNLVELPIVFRGLGIVFLFIRVDSIQHSSREMIDESVDCKSDYHQ